MKKFLFVILSLLTMGISACDELPLPLPIPIPTPGPPAASCDGKSTVSLAASEYETVLVRVKTPLDDVFKMLKEAEIIPRNIPALNVFEVDKDIANLVRSILGDSIIFIEPNYEMRAFTNDVLWDKQWNMQDTKGGANVENAWDLKPDMAQEIIVAVVDTGVDYNHEDIAESIIKGRDWIDGDNDPMDTHGHGTHVSGTIAQATNNGIGAAGISKARILIERVLDENGGGKLDGVASGIKDACDNGAKVINLSLGVNQPCSNTPVLQDVITDCREKGVLVIVAAGNDNSSSPSSPASCDGVIAVTATQINGERASYSNCGEWTHIAAPGGDGDDRVWQSIISNEYAGYRGTSMATPHVAGLAALALANGVQPEDVLGKLCEFSRPVITKNTGCGIVDGYKLIQGISP